MHVRPARLAAGLLALATVSTALTGCGRSARAHAPAARPSPTVTSASPSASARPAALSPLTGLPGSPNCRVVAVKVDNTAPGRPQIGIDAADVVYVEQVEGGLSRLMAVFCSTLPDIAGPARSARLNDLELLREYGHVGLAYSGANRGVVAAVQSSPVANLNEDTSGAFFRGMGRHAPYNLFVHVRQAAASAGVARVRDVGFRFGPPATGVGAKIAHRVVWRYPMATIGFTWEPAVHRWIEATDGMTGMTASGRRLGANNVVIQYVSVRRDRFVDVNGNPTPFSVTVGSGRFTLLRDGRVYQGTWHRANPAAPTVWLDATGRHKLAFAPGRTWVVLASNGSRASVS